MSLIHDALKSMDADAPQPSRPGSSVRVSASGQRGRPAWLDGLLAFGVVVGAGVVGWYVWQGRVLPERAPTPDAAAVVNVEPHTAPQAPVQEAVQGSDSGSTDVALAGAPAAAPVAPPQAAPIDDVPAPAGAAPREAGSAAAVSGSPAAAADSAAVAAAAPARPAARPQATSQHRRAHTSVRRAAVPAAPASPPAPKADDTPVQVRFTRFVAAMRSGQTSDAERELSALKAVLPADALGLQRAQAWFDLRTGNEARAAKAYRGILERLPGDAEAAINLASIQAQEADQEGARATLDAAARLNPDSAALRAALAQYTPNVRQ